MTRMLRTVYQRVLLMLGILFVIVGASGPSRSELAIAGSILLGSVLIASKP